MEWLFPAGAVIAIGGIAGRLISRRCGLPRVARLALSASCIFTSLLAVVTYATSLWHWPIAPGLQLGDGFWTFASDAAHYHANAVLVLERWSYGLPLPSSIEFYDLWVAGVYRVFGVSPIYPALLNSWFWLASAVLTFSISRRLGGSAQAAAISAVMVSWWPSALIWNSQVLREAPVICVVLILARLVCAFALDMEARPPRRWIALPALLIGLVTLYYLRLYVIFAVTLAGVTTSVVFGAMWAARQRWSTVWRAVALGTVFVVCQTVATWVLPNHEVEASQPSTEPIVVQPSGIERVAAWAVPYGGVTPDRVRTVRGGIGEASAPQPTDTVRQVIPLPREPEVRTAPVPGGPEVSVTAPEPSASSRWLNWRPVAALLPRGLGMVLFAPWPWDWLSAGTTSGGLRTFAFLEVLLLYAIWPVFAVAIWRVVRQFRPEALFITAVAALSVGVQAIMIPNLGMIVRHRLLWVVLGLVLAGGTSAWLRVYGPVVSWMIRRTGATRRLLGLGGGVV